MKKLYTIIALLLAVTASAQITVTNAVVPQYTQGQTGTNNERVPFYFRAELSGLTPGATYRYFTTFDTLNAPVSSNGAGNPYFVNLASGDFRRSTGASMSSSAGHDSLVASNTGTYSGWFGMEPDADGRFVPGDTVYPKIMFNDGAGGTSVDTRLLLSAYPVRVLSFGTSLSPAEGSAIYDSAFAVLVPEKSFTFLYDNNSFTGRPLSASVVERENISHQSISSIATFYRDFVDTFPHRWGTIMPNMNANGVRGVEYRDFLTGNVIFVSDDNSGVWCSGANTVNPVNGSTALYLDENFYLQPTMTVQDTAVTGFGANMSATSNAAGTQFTWDFGDGSPSDTTQNPTHVYLAPGTYTVMLTVQAPNCGLSLIDTIVVILFTEINGNNAGDDFMLLPNPAEGELLITTANDHDKRIVVINSIGEIVSTTQLNGTLLRIDLRGNAPGIYFVQVKDEVTGKTGVKKIVLQ